jgi:hypothetical protein
MEDGIWGGHKFYHRNMKITEVHGVFLYATPNGVKYSSQKMRDKRNLEGG